MYLTNSGNTLSRSRTTTPHNTRPVRTGITDKPPLRIMPSLIAFPPRRTPHDVPEAAPTKASAVIDESTRKPPRDRAVTDRERNQNKTPSTILCVNAPLPRIDWESPRESSTRRSAYRGKSQGSSPLPPSGLCAPALVCPSAAPSGTAIGGRGLPRCRFVGGGKRRPGDGDRNASRLRGREWRGDSRTGCSEGESTSTDEGRGALRQAPSQACDERPSSRIRLPARRSRLLVECLQLPSW